MTRYDVILGKVPEVKEDPLPDRYHPAFKLPIKGNKRLEQLRQWIYAGEVTADAVD
jgi:hypothetical protein